MVAISRDDCVRRLYQANDNKGRIPTRERVWIAVVLLFAAIGTVLGWWIERSWLILVRRDQVAIEAARINVPVTLKFCGFAALCATSAIGLGVWGLPEWAIPPLLCYFMATFAFTRLKD